MPIHPQLKLQNAMFFSEMRNNRVLRSSDNIGMMGASIEHRHPFHMGIKYLNRVRLRSFLRGFVRGLSSPAEIYRPRGYRMSTTSPAAALRGDWEKIGRDFRAVMPCRNGGFSPKGRDA